MTTGERVGASRERLRIVRLIGAFPPRTTDDVVFKEELLAAITAIVERSENVPVPSGLPTSAAAASVEANQPT